MITDSERELFYGVALACSCGLLNQRQFNKNSNGLHLIFWALENYKVHFNKIPEIIEALREIANSHPSTSKVFWTDDLGFQRAKGRIYMGFNLNTRLDKISGYGISPTILADQLQVIFETFSEVKKKEISVESGFYSYCFKYGGSPSTLDGILLKLLARNHQLKSKNVKLAACWKMLYDNFIGSAEFPITSFEAMVKEMDEYLSFEKPNMLPRRRVEDNTIYYESRPSPPTGYWGGNIHQWGIDLNENVNFSFGSTTVRCSLRRIKPELDDLLLNLYMIIDKESV